MPSGDTEPSVNPPAATASLAPVELRKLGGDRTHPLLTQVLGDDPSWWPDSTGEWTDLAFVTSELAESQAEKQPQAPVRAIFKAPTGEPIYTIVVNDHSASGNANLVLYRGSMTDTTGNSGDPEDSIGGKSTSNIAGTIHLKKISAVRIWHGIQVANSGGQDGSAPDLQISAPALGGGNCSLGLPVFGVTKEKLGSETNEIVWRGATAQGAAHQILVDRHGTLIAVWQPFGEVATTVDGLKSRARLIFRKCLLDSGGNEVDLLVMVAVAYWENSGEGRKAKGSAARHVSNALDYVGKALIGNNRLFRGTLPADR